GHGEPEKGAGAGRRYGDLDRPKPDADQTAASDLDSCRQLLRFPMSVAQARMLDLKEDTMTTWTYPRQETPVLPFAAELQSLKLRDGIKNKEAISGTMKSRSRDDATRDYHVRVLYRYSSWTTEHTRRLSDGGLAANELININFDVSFSDAYVG